MTRYSKREEEGKNEENDVGAVNWAPLYKSQVMNEIH